MQFKMALLYEFLVIVFLSGMLLGMVQGDVHYYDFVLREKNFTRLCITRSVLVANDSIPGPTIRVHKGDTFYVNLHNQGDSGVTIHWHGVKQPRNPWSDGTSFITQCPIEPGTNFTYEVILSEEEGTVWWHAHNKWTRSSVHGAIVIYPVKGTTHPYPKPDGEEIIILSPWYTFDVNIAVEKDLIIGENLPFSNAYTINSQPGDFYQCSAETTHRWLVDYGKTYLLRVVNGMINEEFFFAIAQHNLTVVGTDGAYIKPIITDYIMIPAGQTMDILVTANQSLSHYYMAARQYFTNQNYSGYDKTNTTAILQYRGDYTPPTLPSFPSALPSNNDFDAGLSFMKHLRSLASQDHPADVPRNITTRMYITTSLNYILYKDGNEIFHFASSLNNVSWGDPSTDILQAYYRNISGFYTTDFPDEPPFYFDFLAEDTGSPYYSMTETGTKVKVLDFNEEVEIVFQVTNIRNASEDHSMHLHGYSFYVVGRGAGIFHNETDPHQYNLVDPPYVNTASVPASGWLALRFKANNPGVWLLHCHLEHHFTWGMQTVFIVKNGGTPQTSMREPPPYMPPCKGSSPIQLQKSKDSAEKANKLDII